jgi:hypothetical protein
MSRAVHLATAADVGRLHHLITQVEAKIMAVGQDILDAVKAQQQSSDALANSVTQLSATVANVVAGVDRLLNAGQIPADVANEILGTLKADQATADAALQTSVAAGQALSDELAKLPPAPAPGA